MRGNASFWQNEEVEQCSATEKVMSTRGVVLDCGPLRQRAGQNSEPPAAGLSTTRRQIGSPSGARTSVGERKTWGMTMSKRAQIADLLSERFPDVHFKVINPPDKPECYCPRDALLVSWVDGPERAPVSAALRPLTQAGIKLECCRDITCERCGQPGLTSPCLKCLPMTDDEVARMPWLRGLMTREELVAWLASRKEAGRAIDIETCELGKWPADDCDPYGIR
jgi:hypothetical protein